MYFFSIACNDTLILHCAIGEAAGHGAGRGSHGTGSGELHPFYIWIGDGAAVLSYDVEDFASVILVDCSHIG
jgi:hypothetical protein